MAKIDAMATHTFLDFVADGLVSHYGREESDEVIQRLRSESARAASLRTNLAQNQKTYMLAEVVDGDDAQRSAYQLLYTAGGGGISSTLYLTDQQAEDLSRQLDAPVDYFND